MTEEPATAKDIAQLWEAIQRLQDELHRRRKDWETAMTHLSRLQQRVTEVETRRVR